MKTAIEQAIEKYQLELDKAEKYGAKYDLDANVGWINLSEVIPYLQTLLQTEREQITAAYLAGRNDPLGVNAHSYYTSTFKTTTDEQK